MGAKRGKRKAAPAIVPRFLKNAVTIGVIPALAGACEKPHRVQPVVAYMAPPSPRDASEPMPPPPVVAAYQPPVVAAYARDATPIAPPIDAAVPADASAKTTDAATKKAKATPDAAATRVPAPVVAMMVPNPGPAVVAAYVPRDPVKPPPKKPTKP
ncbi:MAG: hypothetical protein JO257_30100 [Deltaproteobacteria bacterium]|nr:hypothetical protein [Deltaproteobacteria bacterium]